MCCQAHAEGSLGIGVSLAHYPLSWAFWLDSESPREQLSYGRLHSAAGVGSELERGLANSQIESRGWNYPLSWAFWLGCERPREQFSYGWLVHSAVGVGSELERGLRRHFSTLYGRTLAHRQREYRGWKYSLSWAFWVGPDLFERRPRQRFSYGRPFSR